MRTKLDELRQRLGPDRAWNPEARRLVDEVLSDAFRHGVEQELAREHGGHPHTRAEPAPINCRLCGHEWHPSICRLVTLVGMRASTASCECLGVERRK
jgi:hypothetical protein